MLPDATVSFYQAQQSRTAVLIAAVRAEWSKMGSKSFDPSWTLVAPRVTLLVTAAQQGAAADGVNYVPLVLAELALASDLAGVPDPMSFVGVAPDGRPMQSLLYGAVVSAGRAFNSGHGTAQALAQGGRWLDMVSSSVVADAGRTGASLSIVARPQVTGYVRMLNLPSCSRCVILAGKFYRWSDGFLRHPRCDCVHIPARESMAGDLRTNPKRYFDSLTAAEQDAAFTADGAQAIRDGADISQVVNARLGMGQTQLHGRDVKYTTTGAGRSTARSPRLMPEAIYQISKDRDEVIRLLKKYGYIT